MCTFIIVNNIWLYGAEISSHTLSRITLSDRLEYRYLKWKMKYSIDL